MAIYHNKAIKISILTSIQLGPVVKIDINKYVGRETSTDCSSFSGLRDSHLLTRYNMAVYPDSQHVSHCWSFQRYWRQFLYSKALSNSHSQSVTISDKVTTISYSTFACLYIKDSKLFYAIFSWVHHHSLSSLLSKLCFTQRTTSNLYFFCFCYFS